MITVKFLSGLERRLGLPESSFTYEGPSPVPFRTLINQIPSSQLDAITRPLFANCGGETYRFDTALTELEVPDGETVVIFMINGGG